MSNFIKIDHGVFSDDQQTAGSSNLRTSKTKLMSSQRHSHMMEPHIFGRNEVNSTTQHLSNQRPESRQSSIHFEMIGQDTTDNLEEA
jgi:hypothetical protein